jgi:hypothetical protein
MISIDEGETAMAMTAMERMRGSGTAAPSHAGAFG